MEVIILAGGLGTRLRSVVSDSPKCMAPIGGKAFLWYLLRYLSRREYGISGVTLSVGYLREQVISWVGRHGSEFPFTISFSEEDEPLGTGGAVRRACASAHGRHVAVMNGDTLLDIDLDRLYARHLSDGNAVTLALKEMRDFDRYGTVTTAPDGRITGFEEKRPCARGLINGGVYVIDREADIFPDKDKFSFEQEVLVRVPRLGGMETGGYFIDIGIPEDYRRAGKELPQMFPASLTDIDVSGFDTILLDRDGVINRLLPDDYVKTPGEFEFLPGAVEAIAGWTRQGKSIYVVTNQRGVGRGIMGMSALEEVHRHMLATIEAAGGHVNGIYACTATDGDDPMRKPQAGMFTKLLAEHPETEAGRCLMIGDSRSDMEFAANCGIKGVRL